jgi:SAM-dependent methyltransferase
MTEPVPNAKQRDEWNAIIGSRWLERHEAIDKQLAPFGRRAMERAAIRVGEHVLDVGCGCGETTCELALRVGNSGSIIGVDISRPLLGAARQTAQKLQLSNVQFEEADAQTHPFAPAKFDVVFSRFGSMLFDDPEAAYRNIHSALRPEGRLAFVCWPAPRENLFVTIPMEATARYVTLPPPGEPNAPGPFAFADPERVRGILSRSNFSQIEIEWVTEKVGGGSVEETGDLLLQIGPLGEILNKADERTTRSIRDDIHAALRRFELSGLVRLDASAWLVTARC